MEDRANRGECIDVVNVLQVGPFPEHHIASTGLHISVKTKKPANASSQGVIETWTIQKYRSRNQTLRQASATQRGVSDRVCVLKFILSSTFCRYQ